MHSRTVCAHIQLVLQTIQTLKDLEKHTRQEQLTRELHTACVNIL
jgi:hypothetical protein